MRRRPLPMRARMMQALDDVFDTNHDGSLDAGEANFADFFVMETNANGTKTAYSLAQLGVASINLNANATSIVLPDGSSIDGQTTYATNSGTTGTTATVTFASDPNNYLVATIASTNADGSTTIANVADNADGSVAYFPEFPSMNSSEQLLFRTIALDATFPVSLHASTSYKVPRWNAVV